MAEESSFIKKLEEELTCPICKEIFTKPKWLSCFHSYCTKCISEWYKRTGNQETKQFDCPICKKRIDVPGGEVAKLNPAFVLESILPNFLETKRKFNQEEPGGASTCESCEENLSLDIFCPQCKGKICAPCFDAHKTMKALKDHQPLPRESSEFKEEDIDSFIKKQMFCKEELHENNRLEYFCEEETCRRSICEECVEYNHKKHRVKSLGKAADEIKQLIQKDMNRMKLLKEKYEEEMKNSERTDQEIDVAKKEVHDAAEKIIEAARKHEQVMTQRLNSYKEGNDTEENDIRRCIRNISELLLRCQTLLKGSNEYQVIKNGNALQQSCKELLEKPMIACKQSQRSVTIQYARNEQVEQSLEDIGKILESSRSREDLYCERGETITIDANGSFYDLSSLGVQLQVPPNAVTCPTEITCRKRPQNFHPAPSRDEEVLVSHLVELGPTSLELQKPLIVTLINSGPGKRDGYETIVKSFCSDGFVWKEIRGKPSLQTECVTDCTNNIQVEISKLTALAVVTRLVEDRFEVTEKGCVVRSSVCGNVIVTFPEGAVDKKVRGSMKLLLMPEDLDVGIAAYPGPILLINGFQGIHFETPVNIRLPHPYSSGYPTGQIRLLCMEENGKYIARKWKDITDQIQYEEHKSYIELNVDHFTKYWTWIFKVPLGLASDLYQYLKEPEETVSVGVFKEPHISTTDLQSVTLVCMHNQDVEEKVKNLIEIGYQKLALSTANKQMRPSDKVYIKIKGGVKKVTREENFLQYIKRQICMKELAICKKTEGEDADEDSEKHGELGEQMVVSFLRNKNGDDEEHRCLYTFHIPKHKIFPFSEARASMMAVPYDRSGSALPFQSDSQSQEIVAYVEKNLQILLELDTPTAAKFLASYLAMDKISMTNSSPEKVEQCRYISRICLSKGRRDIVEELRKRVPSGTTGPLLNEDLHYQQMNFVQRQNLTRALCGKDVWRKLAENFGIKAAHLSYFESKDNPADAILQDVCGRQSLTVGELYDKLCICDANAYADEYLK